jgi:hypothetical protein
MLGTFAQPINSLKPTTLARKTSPLSETVKVPPVRLQPSEALHLPLPKTTNGLAVPVSFPEPENKGRHVPSIWPSLERLTQSSMVATTATISAAVIVNRPGTMRRAMTRACRLAPPRVRQIRLSRWKPGPRTSSRRAGSRSSGICVRVPT